ncbi:MAG TPA: SLC13 family permease [Trinickia sp.]|jgi:Na+/H+ antiporter NhaD/arsenite permease-like protein|uniref:SLC13 family permease n=1 Tax=Trinickia sp. TaxID=2571163 RepID=UPI002C44F6F4|nr:SLC13 family permease [Trinickia sp.]HTI18372.1 SLC13 family permease [Trinickia sp.]
MTAAEKAGRSLLRRCISLLGGEPVLSALVVALIATQWRHPRAWTDLPRLVDWPTVMTLAGLLILTKAVELSGVLMWLSHRVVHRVRSERTLAMLLIGLAAALSMIVTNDVALFVVVPLVLSLDKLTPLPVKRLAIFLALAVNAGSVLTPLGNPQNLFLWQTSGVSFGRFVIALFPLCAVLMAMLYGLAACAFAPKPLDLSRDAVSQPVDRPFAVAAAILFVAFVLLADAHHPGIGLAAIGFGFLIWRRDAVLRIDWALLLIFALMFIVLRSVAALPAIREAIAALDLSTPLRAYVAAGVLSQGISNVPAAIMLAEFTRDWRALAFGVSIGGFGIAIGSLANLIAVRLVKKRGIWMAFHLVSIPFWIVGGALGAWLLSVSS